MADFDCSAEATVVLDSGLSVALGVALGAVLGSDFGEATAALHKSENNKALSETNHAKTILLPNRCVLL